MSDVLKLTLAEGDDVEVWGDLDDRNEPIAVLWVNATYDALGEGVELPGLSVPLDTQRYTVRANVSLTRSEVEQVCDALRHASRPLTDEERAKVAAESGKGDPQP